MRYRDILVIVSAFLFSIGCKEENHNVEKIIVDPRSVEESILLSELVDSVFYIKLETRSESILGDQVNRIIIKESYIYVVDIGQDIVFVFDKNGKFVSKLDKLGDGPDQYNFLSHIFVDDNEEYIEVVDGRGEKARILKYSNLTFDFLSESPLYVPSSNSSRREGDIYYFSAQQIENLVNGEVTNADIIAVKKNETQKGLFKKNIATGGVNFTINSENFTVNEKGEIFVSLMYNNSFFRLSNMEAFPIYTVDFGVYGIDNAVGLRSTEQQMDYLEKFTEGLASFPVLSSNNSSFFLFSYFFKKNSKRNLYHFMKFKNLEKIIHVNDIINDFTNFPEKVYLTSFHPINHEVYIDGGYLVEVLIPSQLFEERKKEINVDGIGNIKAEDNPIIMVMKLKEEYIE
ncbi:6-bladed beta-propeller [Belliella sp. DSM 107340]|uniref:6-bladed beta-propeller n=1 Tax=Belliella calami TaxID=2923436 RepID=A0ABS9UJZ9_9BACT|nr:6-bladed beta-propeller [Belliella calami]MCH7396948.1 6-bladed beta-propeller [Belliella calami]